MLRTNAIRAVRTASGPTITRIAATPTYKQHFIRFNSTKADEPPPPQTDAAKAAWRKARNLKDKLNHNWDTPSLTYEQVKSSTLSPSPDAYLIDVREPDEVIQGAIPSSVNLPLSVITHSLHLGRDAFKKKHGFDKPGKEQEIVFYCRSGKRSATACDIAKRNGYTNLRNYEGSWLDWVQKEGAKAK